MAAFSQEMECSRPLRTVGLLACLSCLSAIAKAQALPVATQSRYQVGFAVTYARPDFWVPPAGDPKYSRQFILGVSGYGDYALNDRLSMEGEFHCICLITALDRAELPTLSAPGSPSPMAGIIPTSKA